MLGSYVARLASVYLRSRSAPKVGPLEEVRLALRIWPTDVDTYLHVNNGRYLTLMDFGRLVHGVRTGGAQLMLQRRWKPLLGSATVSFWRELKPFERVDLVTRIAFWDHKWFVFEHRFEKDGVVHALGLARGLLKHQGRTVPPQKWLQGLGHHGSPPEPSEFLRKWIDALPRRPGSEASAA